MQDALNTIGGWMSSATELGLKVVIAAIVVDVLFPDTTGIIGNIGAAVGNFSSNGVAGLIALLLFLVLFRQKTA